ncbi:peptidoglycan/xylan/chitin deacetylase (PgdA/CDA1 family) [Inhella inkyongensis]|uniref:Peptidoglycan/xylan/chitin deacetylase (PgdA/CDA1 family) n=1 Tax=Inhella inkyongensis TaxID=392593 RepID=A0A840S5U2_9BURK|nr:polysaccharide deacetylase family protein [Inhella inkyongensis]MBB5203991.1 peptidoglycan/xylan/chitin deacetylase (PgdA/CDA1 family) [Inhella inkyongensis]
MRVVLSADIEFDINGALTYPRTQTPRGVESVFRECVGGDQGLGFLVDTLDRHGLVGSFFVETLAARHFGVESIRHLVDRIGQNGQTHEIELHVHPEWQHLGQDDWRDSLHTAREQGWRPNPWLASLSPSDFESLLEEAIENFQAATGRRPCVFRAGSLSIARSMYPVLARHGLHMSSSVGLAINPPKDPELGLWHRAAAFDGVNEVPVTSFSDLGLGHWKHRRLLTIAGCTFAEIRKLLEQAHARGCGPVVLLTHASEFSVAVEPSDSRRFLPLEVNMRRLQELCAYLAAQSDRFDVTTLAACASLPATAAREERPLSIGPWQWPRRWADAHAVQRVTVRAQGPQL